MRGPGRAAALGVVAVALLLRALDLSIIPEARLRGFDLEEQLLPRASDPGRVKIISALTFDDRFCRSSDMPCARPVNSITSATPSATPRTLIADRIGRCRMFDTTRLSRRMVLSNAPY